MKAAGTLALASTIFLATLTASFAQQTDTPANQPASRTQTHPDQDRGTTGWSGGTTGAAQNLNARRPAASNPEAPENQPLMATGIDLNGPPTRFAAGQTPE